MTSVNHCHPLVDRIPTAGVGRSFADAAAEEKPKKRDAACAAPAAAAVVAAAGDDVVAASDDAELASVRMPQTDS